MPQKRNFRSLLHMISLHKHCLKNVTSEAIVSLYKYHLQKHNLESSLRIVSLHFIDQAHWVYKHDFRSSLHMISLHKHCLKNATSEAIVSLYKYYLKKHNLRSSLRIVSFHKYCLKNVTSEAHYVWSAFTSYIRLTKV